MNTTTIDQVIDLSHHNAVTSFAQIHGAGIVGIIHKATQGTGTTDGKYASRVGPIRTNGMMAGAYHFGTNADGLRQADFFLRTVRPDGRTLLALDLENNGDDTMTMAQARAFVSRIHAQTGRWPLLYSGNLVRDMLGEARDMTLGACPLWVPRYGAEPIVQPSWSKWTFWQYTEKGEIAGIESDVDREKFAGTIDDLRALWGYPPLS